MKFRSAGRGLLLGAVLATWHVAAILPAVAGESIVRIPPGRPSQMPGPETTTTPPVVPPPPPPPPVAIRPPTPPPPPPAPPPSPPPVAGARYGAIAYSPSTGANGWAYDYGTQSEAESIALANCRKYANDCVVPVWFRNACGALATGPRGYGSGWGTDRSIAERYALQSCSQHSTGCAIQRWVCTTR